MVDQDKFNQTVEEDLPGQLTVLGELRHALELSRSVNNLELSTEINSRVIELAGEVWQGALDRTDKPSYSYRYSWDWSHRGTELQAQANKAVIEFIAQTGRMPEPFEVFQITDRFVDSGPEFLGEAIWDPLNLIPAGLIDDIFMKPLKIVPKKLFEQLTGRAGRAGARWFDDFFVNGAIASNAIRQGNHFNDLVIGLAKASGDDPSEFTRGFGAILAHLQDPSADIAEWGLSRRVLRNFQTVIGSLGSKSPDDILELAARTLRTQGRAETPRNLASVVANEVQDIVLRNNTIKGFNAVGALDEGMVSLLRKKGQLPDASLRKGAVELFLKAERLFRRAWTPLILTGRPGYSVINHLDNSFRAIVHGVNALMNFNSIMTELGPFISHQVRGGFMAHLDEATASVADRIIAKELHTDFVSVWTDGFKRGQGILGKWTAAWGQLNAASKFCWRARFYHKYRTANMELLFRYVNEFLPTLGAWNQLDEVSQTIVREALQVFGDNPAMARRAISGEAGVWSRLLPPGHYDLWKKAFGDDGANQMVKRLTRQLQGLVEAGQLTDANIDLIFDDIVGESRVMIQEAMTDLEAGLARGATDDVISPNLGADAVPEEGLTPSVAGAAPSDPYQNPHLWLSPEERVARDAQNATIASQQGLTPVYNHVPEGKAPSEWGTTNRGFAMTNVGENFASGRRGYLRVTYLTSEQLEQGRVAARAADLAQGVEQIEALPSEVRSALQSYDEAVAAVGEARQGVTEMGRLDSLFNDRAWGKRELDRALSQSGLSEQEARKALTVPSPAEHMVMLEGVGAEWLPEGTPPSVQPIEEAITAPRYIQAFEQEWQDTLNRLGIAADQIPAGDVAELQQFARQVKDTAGQELAKENALFYQAWDARMGAARAAADGTMVQGLADVQRIESALDKLWRRNMREFAANVYPGPWRIQGQYSAQAIRQYFEIEAMALTFHAEQTRVLRGILERDAWEEIGQLPISTRREFFQRIGWKFEFDEDGRLLWFQGPGMARNYKDVGHARTFFNFSSQDDFDNLPLIEGVQPSSRFRQPPAAGATEQDLRDMALNRELWSTVLEKTRTQFGHGATNEGLIDALLGPEAVESPERFVELANAAFEEARLSGDIAKAKYLRDLILEIEGDLNQLRMVEGLAEGFTPHPLQLHRLSPAVQAKIRARGGWIEAQALIESMLDAWRIYLHDAVGTGEAFVRNLSPEQAAALRSIADDTARVLAEGLDVVDNGGQFFGNYIY